MSIRPMRPNRHYSHNVIEPWPNQNKPQTGKCLYWQVVNGKAQQCGKRCKGQRCDDHRGQALANPLGVFRDRGLL